MKLLSVDDSSAVYGRLPGMLGGVAHRTARSIARSLHVAGKKSRQQCSDAVVLDVRLPDGSGLDALSAIKHDSPDTRVHISTNQIESCNKAMRAGTEGFFDKSLVFEARVAQLLGTDFIFRLEARQ